MEEVLIVLLILLLFVAMAFVMFPDKLAEMKAKMSGEEEEIDWGYDDTTATTPATSGDPDRNVDVSYEEAGCTESLILDNLMTCQEDDRAGFGWKWLLEASGGYNDIQNNCTNKVAKYVITASSEWNPTWVVKQEIDMKDYQGDKPSTMTTGIKDMFQNYFEKGAVTFTVDAVDAEGNSMIRMPLVQTINNENAGQDCNDKGIKTKSVFPHWNLNKNFIKNELYINNMYGARAGGPEYIITQPDGYDENDRGDEDEWGHYDGRGKKNVCEVCGITKDIIHPKINGKYYNMEVDCDNDGRKSRVLTGDQMMAKSGYSNDKIFKSSVDCHGGIDLKKDGWSKP